MSKITPYLWFDNNMEEAVNFYVSVFKDAKLISMNPMTATFELFGQRLSALNGGPMYKFTEAVSFMIDCANQAEVDYYWNALSAGGVEQPCGWLKDKYGLSWQVIPGALVRYLTDPATAERAAGAMFKMTKIVIADLDAAVAS